MIQSEFGYPVLAIKNYDQETGMCSIYVDAGKHSAWVHNYDFSDLKGENCGRYKRTSQTNNRGVTK